MAQGTSNSSFHNETRSVVLQFIGSIGGSPQSSQSRRSSGGSVQSLPIWNRSISSDSSSSYQKNYLIDSSNDELSPGRFLSVQDIRKAVHSKSAGTSPSKSPDGDRQQKPKSTPSRNKIKPPPLNSPPPLSSTESSPTDKKDSIPTIAVITPVTPEFPPLSPNDLQKNIVSDGVYEMDENDDEGAKFIDKYSRPPDKSTMSLNLDSTIKCTTLSPQIPEQAFTSLPTNVRTNMSEEILSLQDEYEKVSSLVGLEISTGELKSPESEVAQCLAAIGDRINDRFEDQINAAVRLALSTNDRGPISYENFQRIANTLGNDTDTNSWSRIGLVLTFGKRLAWSTFGHGQRGLFDVCEYTARTIEDGAANFILQGGGWNSVGEIDIESEFPSIAVDRLETIAESSLPNTPTNKSAPVEIPDTAAADYAAGDATPTNPSVHMSGDDTLNNSLNRDDVDATGINNHNSGSLMSVDTASSMDSQASTDTEGSSIQPEDYEAVFSTYAGYFQTTAATLAVSLGVAYSLLK